MKLFARIVLAMLLAGADLVQAGEPAVPLAKLMHPQHIDLADLASARDSQGRSLALRLRQPEVTRAIDAAWKRDAEEDNLKAWSEVLIKCQQATNPAWSTALMRSEPQQSHCYRY